MVQFLVDVDRMVPHFDLPRWFMASETIRKGIKRCSEGIGEGTSSSQWRIRGNHHHNTRYRHLLISNRAKKALYQRHYNHLAPKIYNLIPENIKAIRHIKKFKQQLHNWLINIDRQHIERIFSYNYCNICNILFSTLLKHKKMKTRKHLTIKIARLLKRREINYQFLMDGV